MVHSKHVEEGRGTRKSRDANKARCFDGDFSKGRLEIQNNPRFKKMVYNNVNPRFLSLCIIGCLNLSL